jgi:hypothetical protein
MDAITRLPLDADITDLAGFVASRPSIPEKSVTERRRYRTIWISDVHLGTRGCNAEMLIDFLDHVDSDTMYLVGDIIDAWRLKKKFYWPASHNDIVWRVLKRAKRGDQDHLCSRQSRRDVPPVHRARFRRRPDHAPGDPPDRRRAAAAGAARRRVRRDHALAPLARASRRRSL